MARDIAIDPLTGDWLFTANRDLQVVSANELIKQRIWVRVKIEKGWILDFTGGTLGSRTKSGLRLTSERILDELPLMIEEAVQPMDDIALRRVWTEISPDDPRAAVVHIEYEAIRPFEAQPLIPRPSSHLAFELGFI
jgi:hypothetical protein